MGEATLPSQPSRVSLAARPVCTRIWAAGPSLPPRHTQHAHLTTRERRGARAAGAASGVPARARAPPSREADAAVDARLSAERAATFIRGGEGGGEEGRGEEGRRFFCLDPLSRQKK